MATEKHRASNAAWNKRNPEKARAANKAAKAKWYATNKEKSKAKTAAWQKKNSGRYRVLQISSMYKISAEEAECLLAVTHCEACNRELHGRGRLTRHTDHYHAIGKVRGAICSDCNVALGRVDDDPARLLALVDYLAKHQD